MVVVGVVTSLATTGVLAVLRWMLHWPWRTVLTWVFYVFAFGGFGVIMIGGGAWWCWDVWQDWRGKNGTGGRAAQRRERARRQRG
ncbi:hypothetical protein [Actinacidiphila acidipaludis]|uniref:Uncharacterized protein n=1 Tax=Actinacidiphila acidipaludis TaxID=2873382 RepID=A0ABS7QHS0_9ACTN|nr:hypothetical protein [Streptomyces acidipaludis]MBY8882726.1 hypothetical protein [Streptomyces acidipaludis]